MCGTCGCGQPEEAVSIKKVTAGMQTPAANGHHHQVSLPTLDAATVGFTLDLVTNLFFDFFLELYL